MEAPEKTALASDTPAACTTACTGNTENANAGDFGEALLMLTRLPLTDGERAEAVRRLLSTSIAEATGDKGAGR